MLNTLLDICSESWEESCKKVANFQLSFKFTLSFNHSMLYLLYLLVVFLKKFYDIAIL